MIATNVKRIGRYKGLSPLLDKAIDWILAGGWEALSEGKHEIDGTSLYAIVQRYDSKPIEKCRFETHRNYIDIQMIVSGTEIMEAAEAGSLAVSEPYKPDMEFYSSPAAGGCCSFVCSKGDALVFFPEDAHRPCVAKDGKPEPIHKIVLKVEAV
ncbi:Toxin-antitoxin biofilm protein TabA [bioreactor metagenome]|uniref:Toxin-antitoxin biofilm protein TabA n=1 Tax=bioreactor metagenome TaxID=1076179 RepID=A0A644TV01_9ZZZZ